jgi:ribosomal protein L34E
MSEERYQPHKASFLVVRVPVRTYRERLVCECGGELVVTYARSKLVGREYLHKCQRCGAETEWMDNDRYPRIVHEEVEDDG